MLVRIGGFNRSDITIDAAGITGATTITMDRSDTSSSGVSGGAAYSTQASAGTISAGNFALTNSRDYVTFTVAIAPNW
jgi:hypothetical protein